MNKQTKITTIGLLDKNGNERGFLVMFFGRGIYDFIVWEGGVGYLYYVEEKKLRNFFKKQRGDFPDYIQVTKIDDNSIYLENETIIELCEFEMDELWNRLKIWRDKYEKRL